MPVPTGARFGDCEILAPLGAGGMGEVYRASDNLGREVAVKVLPEELASDPERKRRFEQEARAGIALAFAVPSWEPSDAAKILLEAIREKKVEVYVPQSRGRTVKAIGANPRRLLETIERNEKIGKKSLAARQRINAKG